MVLNTISLTLFQFISCLGILHEESSATDDQYRKYFQLLYKKGEFSTLESVCLDLQPRFNSFYYPLDYLCRLFLEKNISPSSAYLMPNFIDKLFKLYPSSTFGYFAQGKVLLQNGRFLDAIGWLKQGLESKSHPDALALIVTALLRIWDFEGAEDYAIRALKTNPKDASFFCSALCQAFIGEKKTSEARAVLESVGLEAERNVFTALILSAEENWMELDQFLTRVERIDDWHFHYLRAAGDKDKFIDLSARYPDNFDLLLSVGIELSKMGEFEAAINVFTKVSAVFLYSVSLYGLQPQSM
jgi:tetratricopeptide (TPR) repeat protein